MVDRLIVQVAPVLLGVGIPLFAQAEALHRFTLEASTATVSSPSSCIHAEATVWGLCSTC